MPLSHPHKFLVTLPLFFLLLGGLFGFGIKEVGAGCCSAYETMFSSSPFGCEKVDSSEECSQLKSEWGAKTGKISSFEFVPRDCMDLEKCLRVSEGKAELTQEELNAWEEIRRPAIGCCVYTYDRSINNCNPMTKKSCDDILDFGLGGNDFDPRQCTKIRGCPQYVSEQEQEEPTSPTPQLQLEWGMLAVPIPGAEPFSKVGEDVPPGGKYTVNWIAEYIRALYNFVIRIVGILAAVMIMIGGILWITAAGNSGQITLAKSFIGSSLAGLIIALFSYLILYTINPELVTLKGLPIERVQRAEAPSFDELYTWGLDFRVPPEIISKPEEFSRATEIFALGCPEGWQKQPNHKIYLTGYYTPLPPEKQKSGYSCGKGRDGFLADVLLNCGKDDCRGGTEETPSGIWVNNCPKRRCRDVDPDRDDYCNKGADGTSVKAFETAAADPTSFPRNLNLSTISITFPQGKSIKVQNQERSRFPSVTINDTGNAITQCRKIDLYTGGGDEGLQNARAVTGEAFLNFVND